jgi:hypothetical protein
MGFMKYPKAYALTMHDGKGSSKQNRKDEYLNPLMILQVPKTL